MANENPDLSDDIEIEIKVKQAETIQLTCPVCQHQRFEPVILYGKRYLFWMPYNPSGLIEMVGKFLNGPQKRLEAYRCRHCDHIMMFARRLK